MTDTSNTPSDPRPQGNPEGAGSRSGESPGKPADGGAARAPKDVAALVRTIQRDAAEREQIRRTPTSRAQRSRVWYVALGVTLTANLYVWVGQPDWIVGSPPGPQTTAEQEGVLRFRMYVTGQRIEAFRRANGRIPETLEQTGEPYEGMRYQRTGPDSWELLGQMGQAGLILRSTMSMPEFLGNYRDPLSSDGS